MSPRNKPKHHVCQACGYRSGLAVVTDNPAQCPKCHQDALLPEKSTPPTRWLGVRVPATTNAKLERKLATRKQRQLPLRSKQDVLLNLLEQWLDGKVQLRPFG